VVVINAHLFGRPGLIARKVEVLGYELLSDHCSALDLVVLIIRQRVVSVSGG
jgi:hypothetical protein